MRRLGDVRSGEKDTELRHSLRLPGIGTCPGHNANAGRYYPLSAITVTVHLGPVQQPTR